MLCTVFLCVCATQTKEEMVGTVEGVQALQVQSGHLQKSKENYHAKCLELDRLRKEGAPQKELEKVSCQFTWGFRETPAEPKQRVLSRRQRSIIPPRHDCEA